MNKKMISVFICVLVFLLSFCTVSFAADIDSAVPESAFSDIYNVADGNTDFAVFNNLFYAVIPKGYPIIYDEHYSFFTERNNDSLSVDFYTYKNEKCISVADIPENKTKEFCDSVLKKVFDDYGEYKNVTAENTTVNGCNAVLIKCDYNCFEDESSKDFVYVLSTKEVIYAVRFEAFYGFPEADMKKILDTFCMNGVHFGSDKEISAVSFENAPDITKQLETDLQNYDIAVFSEKALDTSDELSEEEIVTVMSVITVFVSIPTLVVTVLAVVFIVKYLKKKKKINEFEDTFVANSLNNQNNYNY